MRAWVSIFAVLPVAICATTGCSADLFHDTEWPTLCELDPSAPGCAAGRANPPDAGDSGSEAEGDVPGDLHESSVEADSEGADGSDSG